MDMLIKMMAPVYADLLEKNAVKLEEIPEIYRDAAKAAWEKTKNGE